MPPLTNNNKIKDQHNLNNYAKTVRNTAAVFLASALWHGANWTFIAWGVIHTICFLPLLLTRKNRKNIKIVAENRYLPSLKELFQMLTTFTITTLAWIFFRATNISTAITYIKHIFTKSLFTVPNIHDAKTFEMLTLVLLITAFICVEWRGRQHDYALQFINQKGKFIQWSILILITFSIAIFLPLKESPFIYFQF
jgi:D-alanyl-lipoteichoic acid acyltransferase DltB (MBOAT superfamily)